MTVPPSSGAPTSIPASDVSDPSGARGGVPGSVRTYHGRAVLKEPEWTWEVPWYLFAGGLAGASSALSLGATAIGNEQLADRARAVAVGAAAVCPPLLIADLGRPARFLNMLRVFKPTSVMSVGSWTLAAYSGAVGTAAGLRLLDRLPRVRIAADVAAGTLGLLMSTYTGALLADTSIPVWHEGRRYLPALFAASSAASAGGAATLLTRGQAAAPARRLAVLGAAAELTIDAAGRRHLGVLGEVYERGAARRFHRAATLLTAVGGGLVAIGGRRPPAAAAGALALIGGAVSQRWAAYHAGFQSARDPIGVIAPQRARLDARRA